ncbi:MAG TPA: hypothetical protein VD963_02940, partial [Phycisphaerales bacterium]|nr:hypothetical protein [Phycisphaerales bacterium]
CPGMIPNAVNSSGAMVGRTCPDGGGPTHAWYWSDATGLIDLTALGAQTAEDINDAGFVTGRSNAGPAYIWSLATGLTLIGTLPPPYEDYAEGQGLNEHNEVVGYSANGIPGSDPWRAFLWDAGVMIEIAPTLLSRSAAEAINEHTHVVGNMGTSSTPRRDAWLWTPEGGTFLLTTESVGAPGFSGYRQAADINDLGQILLMGDNLNIPLDPSRALILTPIGLPPVCPADFNGDGQVTTADISGFLAAWFNDVSSGTTVSDFDNSGSVTTSDISAFLAAWFQAVNTGC